MFVSMPETKAPKVHKQTFCSLKKVEIIYWNVSPSLYIKKKEGIQSTLDIGILYKVH